jgi:hypothetical protein
VENLIAQSKTVAENGGGVGGGRAVKKGLREEQLLTFQALPFILFPHPFHEDRNFDSHKKLRQNNRSFDTNKQKLRHK